MNGEKCVSLSGPIAKCGRKQALIYYFKSAGNTVLHSFLWLLALEELALPTWPLPVLEED